MVKAVLFGSLSTLTNLVEVERKAFNLAFETQGIDLNWSEVTYEKLLRQTGRFSGPTRAVESLPNLDQMAFYQNLERLDPPPAEWSAVMFRKTEDQSVGRSRRRFC